MKKTFITISLFFIIIGAIAVSINYLTQTKAVENLSTFNVGELTFYYYDAQNYFHNIKTAITDTTELQLITPTRVWRWHTDITDFYDCLVNNLALMLDYWIMLLNVTLYPFRVGAYLLRTIMAIIGINVITPNTTSGIYWIVELINQLVPMQIPYI